MCLQPANAAKKSIRESKPPTSVSAFQKVSYIRVIWSSVLPNTIYIAEESLTVEEFLLTVFVIGDINISDV